jgi:hypothetical protein
LKKPKLIFYMRFFIAGFAVILLVELGGLIYVDKSYLQETTNDVKIQEIVTDVDSTGANCKVPISSAAQGISVSYDGNFLAYKQNGALQVMNMTNAKVTTIAMAKGMELNYFKWVYDRDQLIIAETSKDTSDYYAKLYNLNAAAITTDSEPDEIRDTVNNREAVIKMPYQSGDITALDFSTRTVTTYLKITSKYGSNVLWKFNVPDENTAYSYISTKKIGNMQCLKNISDLMYENTANGKVCVAGHGALLINGERRFKLLGFDSNDNVYLARGDSASTDEILYGSIVTTSADGAAQINLEPTDMTSLKLKKSVEVSGIHISLNGGIYYNDSANSAFVNLKTNKKIQYTGTVKAIYDQGFITVRDGVAYQNSLT